MKTIEIVNETMWDEPVAVVVKTKEGAIIHCNHAVAMTTNEDFAHGEREIMQLVETCLHCGAWRLVDSGDGDWVIW